MHEQALHMRTARTTQPEPNVRTATQSKATSVLLLGIVRLLCNILAFSTVQPVSSQSVEIHKRLRVGSRNTTKRLRCRCATAGVGPQLSCLHRMEEGAM